MSSTELNNIDGKSPKIDVSDLVSYFLANAETEATDKPGYILSMVPNIFMSSNISFKQSDRNKVDDIAKKVINDLNKFPSLSAKGYMAYGCFDFYGLTQDDVYNLKMIMRPYNSTYFVSAPCFAADNDEKLAVFSCGTASRLILKSEVEWVNKCKRFLESDRFNSLYQFSLRDSMAESENYLLKKYRSLYWGTHKNSQQMHLKNFHHFINSLTCSR